MNNIVEDTLKLLGLPMRDVVTNFKGMVSTVGFDAYGCVQVVLTPLEQDKDGKVKDACWFDVKRLQRIEHARIMEVPKFLQIKSGDEQGAAPKPANPGFGHLSGSPV